MNPFYDTFPRKLEVRGNLYKIRTDFRAVLKAMHDVKEAKEPLARLLAVLQLYREIPEDKEAAVRAVADFITGSSPKQREGSKEKKPTFSYEEDAPYIVSDFLRDYGIDLTSCGYLHWWKFQILLDGLSDDSSVKTRIGYRSIDTGKIKNREERNRIRKIQRSIALKDTEVDDEQIGELFWNLM